MTDGAAAHIGGGSVRMPGAQAWVRADAPARVGAWPATIALGGVAFAFYLGFVGYGFNLDDEGTVLHQILRTFRGERPYLDFHTGYTPAMFYVNAALFRLFGVSVLPVRVLLAAVNAVAVVLVFRLALRVAPRLESACAALTYALFMPFFAGQFASFNIPYPAWYALAAWLGAELASLKAVEAGRRGWLATSGVLCGIAFSFKPNTGVLALGAAVLSQLLATAPLAGRLGAALETVLLAVAAVATAAVLGFDVASVKFALLGAPVVAWLGVAAHTRRVRRRREPGRTRAVAVGLLDLAALAGGFAAVVLPWLVYFLPRLGLGGFAREVLLLGADVERIYEIHFPDPSGWTMLALGAVALVAALPGAIERNWIGARGLAAVVAAGLLASLVAVSRSALAPEGLAIAIVLQSENLSFFAFPLILVAAVYAWSRGERTAINGGPGARPVTAVLLAFALLLFLQLFPRIDFMHVVISMPSALVLAAGALDRIERRWDRALGSARGGSAGSGPVVAVPPRGAGRRVAIRGLLLAPIVAVLGARALPFAEARVRFDPGPGLRPTTSLGAAAMPVAVERDRDHDLRELRRVVAFVERETGPGDTILAFPALGIVPFLTDRRTPVPHDYFFAGRPSHADEADMLAMIEAARPSLVVALNERLGYFAAAPAYYFLLRDYVQREYVRVRRFGRFDVLMRRDLAARRQAAVRGGVGGKLSVAFAAGAYRREVREARRLARTGRAADLAGSAARLSDVDRRIRQARLLAILGVAAREPGGLPSVARVVAPDRASRLLLLRALGEFGDASALPFLRAEHAANRRTDPRLAREASTAINYVLALELAGRYRLDAPAHGPLWEVPGSLLGDDPVGLLGDFDERQRMGALTALAAASAGRADLAAALEPVQHPRDTSWWRVVSALALARLGHGDELRTMVATTADGTFAEQYVPSLLLDPEVVRPGDAAALLADLARDGTPKERELAAWMAPSLGTAAGDAVIERALRDPDPAVRRAAAWARERGPQPISGGSAAPVAPRGGIGAGDQESAGGTGTRAIATKDGADGPDHRPTSGGQR